jgi:flagellar basal-body rod protein FlgB
MTLDDMPVFAMLKSKLNYLADRQKLIAQNVANADTPGYSPQDLKPFSLGHQSAGGAGMGGSGLTPVSMSVTSAMHIAPPTSAGASGAGSDVTASPDSESTLNGNSVVLEEEMEKMSEARTDYEAAIGFYQKSLSLLQMAAKRPGQ